VYLFLHSTEQNLLLGFPTAVWQSGMAHFGVLFFQ
jgi:hypothetical protein